MSHLRFYALSLVTLVVVSTRAALALADSAADVDEGSCICGLNKEILSKIEAIVKHASDQSQSCSISSSSHEQGEINVTGHSTEAAGSQVTTLVADDRDEPAGTTSVPESTEVQIEASNEGSSHHSGTVVQISQHESMISKLTEEIKALEAQLASSLMTHDQQAKPIQSQQSSSSSSSTTFSSSWRPQQQQDQNSRPTAAVTTSWEMTPPSGSIQTITSSSSQHELSGSQGNEENETSEQVQTQPTREPDVTLGESERPTSTSTNSFLQGLPTSSVGLSGTSSQESNGVTTSSQTGSRPSIQVVQSTLATTVPNVVSNIFSNIQDLAIQTEQNLDGSTSGLSQSSNYLTSIDGSSVHLSKNETTDEITAQGEMLFMQWVDHQIQTLHLTASMASYIRKSALSLFRRIVRQYVERISKLGGRVEDNVRRATQIALNNTQNLTSFLMRNYLYVAGGFMQIIGEQVSSVGKQLDSTGETIAHINLNPFDIVSNVLASLPNPTRYSEYFRAFGKYLMGEQDAKNQQQQQSQIQNENERRRGLLSKTMGALGKTFGSWLGK